MAQQVGVPYGLAQAEWQRRVEPKRLHQHQIQRFQLLQRLDIQRSVAHAVRLGPRPLLPLRMRCKPIGGRRHRRRDGVDGGHHQEDHVVDDVDLAEPIAVFVLGLTEQPEQVVGTGAVAGLRQGGEILLEYLAPPQPSRVRPADGRRLPSGARTRTTALNQDGAVLRLRDVRKSYRRREVLRGATLDMHPGQLVGIVGENGAGKSTLLRILVGDLAMDSGSVECRGGLGYCPQETILHDAFTVEQHLRFFEVAYGLDDLHRAFELLEILGFAQYRHARLGTLSGGTRQKLNLTLALMHDPQVLLLDEPYQGFDWETYLRFWELAGRCETAAAILVVSHLAYDTARLDRLYRLDAGTLRETEQTP